MEYIFTNRLHVNDLRKNVSTLIVNPESFSGGVKCMYMNIGPSASISTDHSHLNSLVTFMLDQNDPLVCMLLTDVVPKYLELIYLEEVIL